MVGEASMVLWLKQVPWAGLDGTPMPHLSLASGLSWVCQVCSGQVDAWWVGK